MQVQVPTYCEIPILKTFDSLAELSSLFLSVELAPQPVKMRVKVIKTTRVIVNSFPNKKPLLLNRLVWGTKQNTLGKECIIFYTLFPYHTTEPTSFNLKYHSTLLVYNLKNCCQENKSINF